MHEIALYYKGVSSSYHSHSLKNKAPLTKHILPILPNRNFRGMRLLCTTNQTQWNDPSQQRPRVEGPVSPAMDAHGVRVQALRLNQFLLLRTVIPCSAWTPKYNLCNKNQTNIKCTNKTQRQILSATHTVPTKIPEKINLNYSTLNKTE